MTEEIVIIGGGQASVQLGDTLRRLGSEAPITIVSEEEHLPYHRPPLSKAYLTGAISEEKLPLRKQEFFNKRQIGLKLGTRVNGIEVAKKTLSFEDGSQYPYDKLALATGTRVRPLPLPGDHCKNVHYLRTLEDTSEIARQMEQAESVVVIGGGFIGLEVAASAKKLGKDVTCIEAAPRLLGRVVSPSISDFYLKVHTRRGTKVVLDAAVVGFDVVEHQVTGVQLDGGEVHPADLVVIGIGVLPNSELAQAAGIHCDNGIVVDEFARTSAPDVVAAGDCTLHPNPFAGGSIRLESVQNAIDQAKTAASTLMGNLEPYQAVPWFWSDQYDLKLQIAGLSNEFDFEVLRGDVESEKFSLLYFKGHQFIAMDSVNSPAEHMVARKLLATNISPTIEQAGDPNFDLKTLL